MRSGKRGSRIVTRSRASRKMIEENHCFLTGGGGDWGKVDEVSLFLLASQNTRSHW